MQLCTETSKKTNIVTYDSKKYQKNAVPSFHYCETFHFQNNRIISLFHILFLLHVSMMTLCVN